MLKSKQLLLKSSWFENLVHVRLPTTVLPSYLFFQRGVFFFGLGQYRRTWCGLWRICWFILQNYSEREKAASLWHNHQVQGQAGLYKSSSSSSGLAYTLHTTSASTMSHQWNKKLPTRQFASICAELLSNLIQIQHVLWSSNLKKGNINVEKRFIPHCSLYNNLTLIFNIKICLLGSGVK